MWIIKIKYFYSPRILEELWCIYSCLQTPPRENWFQYVSREYATAINFPCFITLIYLNFNIPINHVLFPILNWIYPDSSVNPNRGNLLLNQKVCKIVIIVSMKIQGYPQSTGCPTKYRVSHETWQLVNSLKCLLP